MCASQKPGRDGEKNHREGVDWLLWMLTRYTPLKRERCDGHGPIIGEFKANPGMASLALHHTDPKRRAAAVDFLSAYAEPTDDLYKACLAMSRGDSDEYVRATCISYLTERCVLSSMPRAYNALLEAFWDISETEYIRIHAYKSLVILSAAPYKPELGRLYELTSLDEIDWYFVRSLGPQADTDQL